MQSYDPNQPQQRSHDGNGYYQQPPQNQPRMTLPPASSFFGPQSSSDYHHSNTPLSEPPPSPYLTGQYNQPQSYPSTDPSTPYMHASAISPQNYNIGPSPHYPPQPPMQQQQMYNPPPQNIDQGYVGMEQQQQHLHGHPHQQQRQQHPPPQHHQMQMGYPSTSMIPQEQSMQMGYMSPMDQGMMGGGNYPQQQQQIRTYSNIPPSQPQQHQQSMHQMPMMQQQQQQIQHLQHHSHSEPSIRHHSEISNNSMLRNNHQILRQQSQPQSIPSSSMQGRPLPSTMESIVPSSENMTQVLQMQHSSLQQPSQHQQQHQSQQEREAVLIISDNNKMLPPPSHPSSNYNMPHQQQQQHTVMNQGMDQRRFDGPPVETQYIHPHSNTYSEQNYRHITPMGPPPIPHRVFHEQQQQQVSQDYHQQQMFESQQQHQQQIQISNFSSMNEPIHVFQTKPEQPQISHSELSIAETVNEVIAKHSAKVQDDDSATPSPQPQPKKRRNTRTVDPVVETTPVMIEQPNVGPTVKQHFQAQQNEKRKQEQHDKYLTKIQEDKERYKNAGFDVDFPEPSQMEPFRGPGMTRTEFLQAHRQRKSESHQEHPSKQQFEKDTVVQIIEEIAGSNFSKSPQPPPYEFSQHQFNDNIQIIEADPHEQIQPTMQSFDDIPDTVVTPTKPKPKRVRKKPPPRETKVQKENKKKFLFKCLHLQRTIRSLILKNSALADETSRLFYRIKTVTEERKMLAKRVQHYERNRIRRIQSQKKKKAKAEAQMAQAFVQQEIQEVNYPPSVEIYEPEVVKESVEAYPFENMMHKEMTVYLPQPNEADFGQIPYLDPSQYPFEDFNDPMNPNSDYSNIVYSGPTQFDEYSNQQNYQQSFQSEIQEEGQPPSKRQRIDPAHFEQHHQYFNPEDDNHSHAYFEQQSYQQQQPISRSETPTFRETPNSSSAASSRPHSSLSGQIKRGIR